jgi:hypothetical protein
MGGSLIFVIYTILYLSFSNFITRMVDKEYEKRNFKVGEICYLSHEPYSKKSTESYISISSYFFLVDGLKSRNLVRPYFPFNKQFPNFIEKMNRKRCYKAEYLEVKILALRNI